MARWWHVTTGGGCDGDVAQLGDDYWALLTSDEPGNECRAPRRDDEPAVVAIYRGLADDQDTSEVLAEHSGANSAACIAWAEAWRPSLDGLGDVDDIDGRELLWDIVDEHGLALHRASERVEELGTDEAYEAYDAVIRGLDAGLDGDEVLAVWNALPEDSREWGETESGGEDQREMTAWGIAHFILNRAPESWLAGGGFGAGLGLWNPKG